MAILDWPASSAYRPALPYSFGVETQKSASRGFYTGQQESSSHLSDRFVLKMDLPAVTAQEGAARSAFLTGAISRGDIFRMSVPHHQSNRGTLSGTVSVSVAALAGARSIVLSGGAAFASLAGGDFFGVGGDLLLVDGQGATADGGGVINVPLSLPLNRPVTAGASVALIKPTGLWQIDDSSGVNFEYQVGVQMGASITLRQVIL